MVETAIPYLNIAKISNIQTLAQSTITVNEYIFNQDYII